MHDHDSISAPMVFRLDQQRGLVVEQLLPRSEREWPVTLNDCQATLLRLLPRLKFNREGQNHRSAG